MEVECYRRKPDNLGAVRKVVVGQEMVYWIELQGAKHSNTSRYKVLRAFATPQIASRDRFLLGEDFPNSP